MHGSRLATICAALLVALTTTYAQTPQSTLQAEVNLTYLLRVDAQVRGGSTPPVSRDTLIRVFR